MPWARLDDSFWRNEKIKRVGNDALAVYLLAISYSAGELTDGLIDEETLHILSYKRHVDGAVVAADLVRAGLWEDRGEGRYAIHDYLKYNPSREVVLKQRAKDRGRLDDWRERRHTDACNAVTQPSCNAVDNAIRTSVPVPVPVPYPDPDPGPGSEAEASDDSRRSSEIARTVSTPEPRFGEDSEPYRIALYLRERIVQTSPRARVPAPSPQKLARWADEADKLLRLDERPPDEVRAVIDWCQTDHFWRANILSVAKLREKYDTLDIQRRRLRYNGKGNGKPTGHSLEDWLASDDPYMAKIEANRRAEEAERNALN